MEHGLPVQRSSAHHADVGGDHGEQVARADLGGAFHLNHHGHHGNHG